MPFPPTSRYSQSRHRPDRRRDGRTVTYLSRRFVPPPENFSLLQTYVVVQGDRLDNVTAKFLGDPVQFWRLCDANRAMRPDELTETIGRRLRITLPEGIPGVPMLDGIHLTLLIGPLPVPVPAPLPLMEALQSVQVNSGRNGSGFQLKFTVEQDLADPDRRCCPSGALDPMSTRVVVIVTLSGIPQVIMDGVVTQHQLSPSNDAGTVHAHADRRGPERADERRAKCELPGRRCRIHAQSTSILGRIRHVRHRPVVVPSPVDHRTSPTEGFDMQTETDLDYIKDLAPKLRLHFLRRARAGAAAQHRLLRPGRAHLRFRNRR